MGRIGIGIGRTLALSLLAARLGAATLEGTVRNADTGEALSFANVLLSGGDRARGTITGAEGVYRFLNVPPGAYTLRITYVGFEPDTAAVTVGEGLLQLDVSLTPGAFEFPEVAVVEDRFASERSLQSGFIGVDAPTLSAIPALGEADPIRALQLLPGVQSASDISSGLYVRGGGPDQTLILLDTVTLYNPTHAFGLFSTFNADVIEDVALYKGAYPARYGGRLGAVLDVTGREGHRDATRGKLALSTVSGRATLEGPVGRGSFLVSGRRTYLDPILSALRKGTPEIPSYYFYDLNGRMTIGGRGRDEVDVSGYTGRDQLGLDLEDGTNVDIRWGNDSLRGAYRTMLHRNWIGTASLSVSRYASETSVVFLDTPLDFDNRLEDVTLRAEALGSLGDHEVRAGVEGNAYRFEFRQRFNLDTQIDEREEPRGAAVFLEEAWSPSPGTGIRAGARLRTFTTGRRVLVEPRLSGSLRLSDAVQLKAGGGVYHQLLQLVSTEGFSGTDFYVPIDASAEPGRSVQATLGGEWAVSPAYRVSLDGYYTDLGELLLLDNEVAVDQEGTDTADTFKTGGEGYATGVELFLERRRGALTGWIGYTLGWTRRRFAEVNDGGWFPPKYDRRHDVNVVLNWQRGAWRYGASFVYATGQAFTPVAARYGIQNPATGQVPDGGQYLPAEKNSARLLPYHRLDLNVSKGFTVFGREARWFLQVFNAYSRRNEWYVQFDEEDAGNAPTVTKQLPIIPSLGVEVSF